jgi:hypothetical protein
MLSPRYFLDAPIWSTCSCHCNDSLRDEGRPRAMFGGRDGRTCGKSCCPTVG